ncbi:MAG: MarP family serine protease [Acidothermus cellulolyticus]|nr:MarP family serine protease [Acidothermus cellulolyticus]
MHGDWLDLLLLVLIAAAAFDGYRAGFVVGVLSFVGLVGGGVAGAFLAPVLARHFSGNARAIAGVITVFVLASIGRGLAGALGAFLRDRVRGQSGRIVDAIAGAIISVIAVLLVAWFIGSSLVRSPFPAVARAVNNSRILAAVDREMPPTVAAWFADFRRVVVDGALPRVFSALGAERIIPVAPPDPAILSDPDVRRAEASVVKITGIARACSRDVEGSGFVFAPGRVMTNAHVVAGVTHPVVHLAMSDARYAAVVVYYDPRVDVAVLRVDGLTAPPLEFDQTQAETGDSAAIAGFPENGPYTVVPARIRGAEFARGPDIYQSTQVTREVYAIRGDVEPGNSGGPLLDPAGRVDGVIFGKAVNDPQTGYALTASQVAAAARAGVTATQPVSTQGCD